MSSFAVQRMANEKPITFRLTTGKFFDLVLFVATFRYAKKSSRFGVKDRWFAKQSFKTGVMARRLVERINESGPTFGIEGKDSPIRQPLLGLA
jgi:hypothetical protein